MTVESSALTVCPSHALLAPTKRFIKHERRRGLDLTILGPPENCEYHLTVLPLPGEGLSDMFYRLSDILLEFGARPVHQFVFGSAAQLRHGQEVLRRIFVQTDWPITWVEGKSCNGNAVAGMQVFAISPRRIKRIQWNGRVVGCVFSDNMAKHCILGGLSAANIQQEKEKQTQQTLEAIESSLHDNGFTYGDIMRTWFYLDDILSWYGPFNKARTEFYSQRVFRIKATPASTGVSGINPAGGAMAMAAWAVKPLKSSFSVQSIVSPWQCPAPSYGSSFSRAVEMTLPVGRRILVSGTASISLCGKTIFPADLNAQIAETMEVVEAILTSREMSFNDTLRATAYFKSPSYVPIFEAWCKTRDLTLPAVMVNCDICRDDLLFEIELDAASEHPLKDTTH
jgi:enamine deaminase RidA (YjgF/YER057c/UK114 family)